MCAVGRRRAPGSRGSWVLVRGHVWHTLPGRLPTSVRWTGGAQQCRLSQASCIRVHAGLRSCSLPTPRPDALRGRAITAGPVSGSSLCAPRSPLGSAGILGVSHCIVGATETQRGELEPELRPQGSHVLLLLAGVPPCTPLQLCSHPAAPLLQEPPAPQPSPFTRPSPPQPLPWQSWCLEQAAPCLGSPPPPTGRGREERPWLRPGGGAVGVLPSAGSLRPAPGWAWLGTGSLVTAPAPQGWGRAGGHRPLGAGTGPPLGPCRSQGSRPFLLLLTEGLALCGAETRRRTSAVPGPALLLAGRPPRLPATFQGPGLPLSPEEPCRPLQRRQQL